MRQASHAVPDIALDAGASTAAASTATDTHFADACDRAGRDGTGAVMTHCLADDFRPHAREQIYGRIR